MRIRKDFSKKFSMMLVMTYEDDNLRFSKIVKLNGHMTINKNKNLEG